jgi:hypothetical protein
MLYHLGHFEESVSIRTDNPIEEIWSFFLRNSDVNYLKKVWTDRTEVEYIYVSMCLKQSYEYYVASKGLTLNTKPLLLYYSFLNLTKATLFILNDERPPDYHGLCKENLNNDLTSANDILEFSAEINNGVFKKLAEALGFELVLNRRFTLGEFLMNAIELNSDYCNYFSKKPGFIIPKVDAFIDGEIDITISNCVQNQEDGLGEKMINFFNEFSSEFKESSLVLKKKIELSKIGDKEYDKKACLLLNKYFSYSVFSDGQYYINVNEDDLRMPNALAYFGIMYILSSIVRYKPDKLHQLINDKDTSVNWLLNKFCSIAERVYPNLMLNLLHGQSIKFSANI